MNQKKKILIYMFMCSMVILCACGKKAKSIPYTDLYFDASEEDIIALEGDDYETYDSIYYGTTYTYTKDYLGRTGKIKYMTDAEGNLCNAAWAYTAEDSEHADILYKEIYSAIQKEYGAPTDKSGVNNYGAVWKRADGNIILSAMISSEINAVQVAFLSPNVSRDENGKASDAASAAAPSQTEDTEDESLTVTLEDIKAANSFESLIKNHKIVYYKAMQYANEDVDDGYLGFDNAVLKGNDGDFSYESSAASQSVPFNDVIEKNDEGKYVEKTQFAGESIVESVYETEDEAKKVMSRLWYFDSEEFAKETITSTDMQDDAIVVTTTRTPNGGEYASDAITRYYFLNPNDLSVLAINEYMPTDTDYGTVLTNYEFVYDKEPDFTIEFFPEPESSITEENYENMSSPDDGEE